MVCIYQSHSVHELDVDGSYIGALADITTERRLRGPTGIFFLHRLVTTVDHMYRHIIVSLSLSVSVSFFCDVLVVLYLYLLRILFIYLFICLGVSLWQAMTIARCLYSIARHQGRLFPPCLSMAPFYDIHTSLQLSFIHGYIYIYTN